MAYIQRLMFPPRLRHQVISSGVSSLDELGWHRPGHLFPRGCMGSMSEMEQTEEEQQPSEEAASEAQAETAPPPAEEATSVSNVMKFMVCAEEGVCQDGS